MYRNYAPTKSYVHKIEYPGMCFDWLTSGIHSEHTKAWLEKWLGKGWFETLMLRRETQPRKYNMMAAQESPMPTANKKYCLPSFKWQGSSAYAK